MESDSSEISESEKQNEGKIVEDLRLQIRQTANISFENIWHVIILSNIFCF